MELERIHYIFLVSIIISVILIQNGLSEASGYKGSETLNDFPRSQFESQPKKNSDEKDMKYCRKCDVTLSNRQNHKRREKKQHPDKTLFLRTFDGCGEGFDATKSFKGHERERHGMPSDICEACGEGFATKIALDMHFKGNHTERNAYGCGKCSATFAWRSNWQRHENTVHGIAKHRCGHCPVTFTRMESLRRHEKTCKRNSRGIHAPKKESPYFCGKCGKTFKYCEYRKFKYHLEKHRKNVLCPICHRGFGLNASGYEKFERHVRIHDREEVGKFDLKTLWPNQHYGTLLNDLRSVTPDVPKNKRTKPEQNPEYGHAVRRGDIRSRLIWAMEGCGKRFRHRRSLRNHERLGHGWMEKFKTIFATFCTKCDGKFHSRRELKRHFNEQHPTEIFEYVCGICSTTFSQSSSLKRHERSTHGPTKFSCKYCHITTARKDGNVRHERRCKGRQLRLESQCRCEECGAVFEKEYLYKFRYHVKRHVKFWTCPVCWKGFSKNMGWSRLEHHVNVHHPEALESGIFDEFKKKHSDDLLKPKEEPEDLKK